MSDRFNDSTMVERMHAWSTCEALKIIEHHDDRSAMGEVRVSVMYIPSARRLIFVIICMVHADIITIMIMYR